MSIMSIMILVIECIFSYSLMAGLCKLIARRNPSADITGINRVKYSYAFGLIECIFSYSLMAGLCKLIARRNPSADITGINRVKYSYAFGLLVMFIVGCTVTCCQIKAPGLDKILGYASSIALIPSFLLSILESHRDPENKATKNMAFILGGIIVFYGLAIYCSRQIIQKGTTELEKTLSETLGSDNPDLKVAIEQSIKQIDNNGDLKLDKEIQENLDNLLKEVS